MLDDREGVEVLDPTDLSDLTDPSDSAIRPAKGQPSTPLMVREPRVRYGTACSAPETDQVARRIGIRGEHPAVRAALDTAAALATHPVPVLIEGETGTGKSLVARLVHELSGRAGGPFVQVNCGALPEKLVESTLFGHRKGAFTGATDDHAGKFAAADGGTLFLDEVGELPLELQPKLLKVLEDGMVEPVGAAKGYAVDVRVIAATNRDLKAMVAGRTFREDLYYRLSFGIIRLPPLRERRTDIRPLALHALARVNRTLRTPKQLSPEAIERLEQQEWRGNVRDLENVIGRSALLARADVLDAADLVIEDPVRADDPLSMLPTPNESFSLEGFLDSARKQLILRALDIAGGSQAGAARLLGVTPQAVHKFLNPR
ncbi:MAG TPA: sigma 54-interacting transcriptional regulator [Kiritimatiellia bacterium]